MTATLALVTSDGVPAEWTYEYELEGDGVQVAVTHLATGLVTIHDTLPDAYHFTGRPDVVDCLIAVALGTVEGFALDDDKAAALAALDKLLADGRLLPPTVEAEHRCSCGGFLARRGRLAHIDVCADEVAGRPCSDRHKRCDRPKVMQCEHPACKRPNRALALACLYGHEYCCGCCHGED